MTDLIFWDTLTLAYGNIFVPESQVVTIEFGMNTKGFRYIFCTIATAGIGILYIPKTEVRF
jgi:hypothetical protein